jgi:hypothetical protein
MCVTFHWGPGFGAQSGTYKIPNSLNAWVA